MQNVVQLNAAQVAAANAAVAKICDAYNALNPLSTPPTPPGLITPGNRLCYTHLKMALARACWRLSNRFDISQHPGGSGVMTGNVANQNPAYTIPDFRDGIEELRTGSHDNIIVLDTGIFDATGACGGAVAGTEVNQRLLATLLAHEYCHVIENSGNDSCRQYRMHILIIEMQGCLSNLFDLLCGPGGIPAPGQPGFGLWRLLGPQHALQIAAVRRNAKQFGWDL